jgi:hypothetical protein
MSFLRLAAPLLFTSALATAACGNASGGDDTHCEVECGMASPVLQSSKALAAVTPADAKVCQTALVCNGTGADCMSLRLDLFAQGTCTLALHYIDGTHATFATKVTGGTAVCCPGFSINPATLP